MAGFKVVVLRHGYLSTETERRVVLAAGGTLVDTDGWPLDAALKECEQAEGILVRWFPLGLDLLRRFGRCRIVVRYGVGHDNVDLAAATAAGIMVGHAPAYCSDEVATHTLALLLACIRNAVTIHQRLARGGWEPNPPEKSHRMAGRTFGMVGFGSIGQSVARKLGGWGMRLLATDPYVEPARAAALGVELVDLETLCRQSDYVSLHVPLLPETRHLIGRRELEWMKSGVTVVNTARGPVLDTAALLAALNAGRVNAAGLDVFEEEPLAASSPLRGHPRVVLSDHTAWYSEESLAELQRTVAEEAVRVCTGGLPVALANPEVLQRLGRASEWTPNDAARWQLKRLAHQRVPVGAISA